MQYKIVSRHVKGTMGTWAGDRIDSEIQPIFDQAVVGGWRLFQFDVEPGPSGSFTVVMVWERDDPPPPASTPPTTQIQDS